MSACEATISLGGELGMALLAARIARQRSIVLTWHGQLVPFAAVLPWLAFALHRPHALACAWALSGIAVSAQTDAECGAVFDGVTLCALAGCIALDMLGGALPAASFGSVAGAGIIALPHLLTRGRGMGMGDVKLGAVLGAGMGVHAAIVAIGAAFVSGAALCSWQLLRGLLRRGDSVRFAPYLAVGAAIAMLVGGTYR